MVVYNYSGREINAKIVYYGPALSGKTTNLEWIYSKIPTEYSGKMVSLRTQADRTIFFDFLPLELGLIDGYKTRFMLYTVPGQVYYNATRKMVLKGVDGLVFVADSQEDRVAANLESWQNLKDNLGELGLDVASLPVVLQWNKRDLPGCVSSSDMNAQLNEFGVPAFEASALTGEGVYETLHRICRMIYHKLTLGDHAGAASGDETEDPATSLFGDAIAARLQELDLPVPEPEPVSIQAAGSFERQDSASAPPVMQAILNGAGADPRGGGHMRQRQTPVAGHVSQPTGTTTSTHGVGHDPASRGSAPNVPHPPAGSRPRSHPTAPIQRSGTAATPPATPGSGATQRPEEEQDAVVSNLVDQVLVQLDEKPGGTAPPAPPTASQNPPSGLSTDPKGSPQGTGSVAAEGLDSLLGDEAARGHAPNHDQPEIEHDVDLFEKMDADSRRRAVQRPEEPPSPDVEEFDLITDPLRLSREQQADASGSSRGASSVTPFGGPIANAKVLEVPITLDADALADGKTIRIVLNLQVKR